MLKEAPKLVIVLAFLGSTATFAVWKSFTRQEERFACPTHTPEEPINNSIRTSCPSDNILKALVKSREAVQDFGIDQTSDCLSNYIRRRFIREPPQVPVF